MKSAVDSLLSLLLFGIMENDNFFCETQIKILYLKRFKNIFIYTWCEDIHSRENMRRSGCPLVHVYFFFGSHSSFVLSYRVLRESLDFLRTELRLFCSDDWNDMPEESLPVINVRWRLSKIIWHGVADIVSYLKMFGPIFILWIVGG